jgi:hypothetical protein
MRSRWRLAVVLAGVVAAGLASRRWPLPGVFAEHTGDALYATAACFAFAGLRPAAGRAAMAAAGLLFAVAIELSQLATWDWLQHLRANRFAALLLGQGFVWADFPAYASGAVLAALLDAIIFRGSPHATGSFDTLPDHSAPSP